MLFGTAPIFEDEPPGNDLYTTLLLNFEGAWSDSSIGGAGSPHTVTRYNGVSFDNLKKKFGSYSGYFEGTNSNDYLRIEHHADHEFRSGDFTVDCWLRPENVTVTNRTFYFSAVGQKTLAIQQIGTAFALYAGNDGNNWNIADGRVMGAGRLSAGVWSHFALTRQGSSWRTFVDGVLVDTFTSALSLYAGTAYMAVGANPGTNSYYGNIDEFRLSKGIARWTPNFVPPTEAYRV